MKRAVVYLAGFIFLISCNTGKKADPAATQVTILGTVHFPTGKVNADSIYAVLGKVKPDFILMEADASVFNPDFSFKKTFDENEFKAVIKYREENPSVRVRPIEFEGRNEYRKSIGIFSEAGPVFGKLNTLNNEGVFTLAEQLIWNKFEKFWVLADSIGLGDLKTLNNRSSDTTIDSLMYYQYTRIKRIIDAREEFEKTRIRDARNDTVTLREYFAKWSDFEGNLRNKTLSRNVLAIIRTNPGKRIIVLSGFKHRFYILKELKENQKKEEFKLKEFYEY